MTAPFDRSAAIARVGFLMPGLTDAGLAEALRCVEVMAQHHARDLTPATLAAEQRAREAPAVAEGLARSASVSTPSMVKCRHGVLFSVPCGDCEGRAVTHIVHHAAHPGATTWACGAALTGWSTAIAAGVTCEDCKAREREGDPGPADSNF